MSFHEVVGLMNHEEVDFEAVVVVERVVHWMVHEIDWR